MRAQGGRRKGNGCEEYSKWKKEGGRERDGIFPQRALVIAGNAQQPGAVSTGKEIRSNDCDKQVSVTTHCEVGDPFENVVEKTLK